MLSATLNKLLAYKTWQTNSLLAAFVALPPGEAERRRCTRWESIGYTLSHVLVVDDIFKHHLQGDRHPYTIRNTQERFPVSELWARQRDMDRWYSEYAARLAPEELGETVSFEFVGGGRGHMTRAEILLHVVNHGTYHRGLISDMLCHVPAEMPASDLPVFLREAR